MGPVGTRSRRLIPSVSDKIPAETEAGEWRLRLRTTGCAALGWMIRGRPPSPSDDASQPSVPVVHVGIEARQYPATRAVWTLLPRTRRDPARRCALRSQSRQGCGRVWFRQRPARSSADRAMRHPAASGRARVPDGRAAFKTVAWPPPRTPSRAEILKAARLSVVALPGSCLTCRLMFPDSASSHCGRRGEDGEVRTGPARMSGHSGPRPSN
jgi:hypothetical protein